MFYPTPAPNDEVMDTANGCTLTVELQAARQCQNKDYLYSHIGVFSSATAFSRDVMP